VIYDCQHNENFVIAAFPKDKNYTIIKAPIKNLFYKITNLMIRIHKIKIYFFEFMFFGFNLGFSHLHSNLLFIRLQQTSGYFLIKIPANLFLIF